MFEKKTRDLILFVEAKKQEHKWIFNFNDSDTHKVYEFARTVIPAVGHCATIPYMMSPFKLANFFDETFNFNMFWHASTSYSNPRTYTDTEYKIYDPITKELS